MLRNLTLIHSLKTIKIMESKLSSFFKVFMILGILSCMRSAFQGFMYMDFLPVAAFLMLLFSAAFALCYGLSLGGKKAGLVGFYVLCVLSVIVMTLAVDMETGRMQLLNSVVSAIFYTALLQVRKNGVPAWRVLMENSGK